MDIEIKNAVIESVSLQIERGFVLDSWVHLDYGGSGQGFGGWVLYLNKTAKHHTIESLAGHWIYRCMQIAGVESWGEMKGKTVRVKCEHTKVHAIGHIVKDDWFEPAVEFVTKEQQ
jgi:hypothetical protein